MEAKNIKENYQKLAQKFGAKPISAVSNIPKGITAFENNLIVSHRDFDNYLKKLKAGKKCAISTGANPSANLHIGHYLNFKLVTELQKKYGVFVFVPLSNDESYFARKSNSLEQGEKQAIELIKDFLALGFDPKKTKFIIDTVYTDIYKLAAKFARQVTLSMTKATYGFTNETNIGLNFYPAVQAAHVLLPMVLGYDCSLTPIGADEDLHLRIARDIAQKFKLEKPAVIHTRFLKGLDKGKMSKSRPEYAIFLNENPKTAAKKCLRAFTGGQGTINKQKEKGGNPDICMVNEYLSLLFETEKQTKERESKCRQGKMLCSEGKKLLAEKVEKLLSDFQKKRKKVKKSDIEKVILRNGDVKL